MAIDRQGAWITTEGFAQASSLTARHRESCPKNRRKSVGQKPPLLDRALVVQQIMPTAVFSMVVRLSLCTWSSTLGEPRPRLDNFVSSALTSRHLTTGSIQSSCQPTEHLFNFDQRLPITPPSRCISFSHVGMGRVWGWGSTDPHVCLAASLALDGTEFRPI